MRRIRQLWLRVRLLFRRSQIERELDDEFAFHLDQQTRENIAAGMPPEEARRAARRLIGGIAQLKEECREMRSVSYIEEFFDDVRYSLRSLRKSPGFASLAVVTLALGIGANAAIFQLLDAVRLRSLPVWNPQELAQVKIVGGNRGMGLNPARYAQLTRPIWQELSAQQEAFSGAFAWGTSELRVGQPSDLRRANGIRVSGGFFSTLGVSPWSGRLLAPEDEAGYCPGSRVVVSYAYWLNHWRRCGLKIQQHPRQDATRGVRARFAVP